MIQNLAIASDHAGYNLKTLLINQLDSDINIKDFGTDNENSCDFPDFAQELCNFINENNSSYRGLLICGSGVGMSIAANKIKGIRAANVVDELTAIQSVEHNNVNVLCLGSNNVSNENALSIVLKFLNTYMLEEERYIRRVGKIEN